MFALHDLPVHYIQLATCRDVNKARGVKANKPRPETCKAKAMDPRPRMRT